MQDRSILTKATLIDSVPDGLPARDQSSLTMRSSAAVMGKSSSRISALDFTKGALVLFMVLYHWLNYFVTPEGSVYRYLRFLTPSFIFIAGFLVSNVYFPKYRRGDSKVPVRLLIRGLKILAVFLVLNLVIGMLISMSTTGQLVPEHFSVAASSLYIFGTTSVAGVKAAVFYVLIPISYLLMVSALLLLVGGRYRYTFHIAAAFCLLAIYFFDRRGMQNSNLELLTMGLLGVIAGYLPLAQINRFVGSPYTLLILYALYLGAITFWSTPYPLQIVGVCLTLLVLYALGSSEEEPGRVRAHIILLGKYSLLGYIIQMAFLQIIHRFVRQIDFGDHGLVVSFLLGFGLTMTSIELVDRLRKKSGMFDAGYKAVFA
jgi:peptidoglycan/LPS O-acetylase OafA/YrhL